MTLGLRRAGFIAALALVIGVHFFALVHGIALSRVWGDEAYNLTVSINLAAGHGYASDGILTTGRYHLFDPRVSTGPTVLVPIAGVIALGFDPVTAGRVVMAVMYVGAVVAIALLGWRIARANGLIIALALPLAFDATNPDSPMQSPIDVIGEWPAAGLLALSLVYVWRRPWFGGLLLGIAIQAKFIAILSVPIIAAMLLVATTPLWTRVRAAFVFCAIVALPTLVFELVKVMVLGPAGYARWLGGFLEFLLLKRGHFLPLDKARALLDSWFIPSTWVVVLVVVVGLVATFLAVRRRGFRVCFEAVRERNDFWIVAVCALLAVVWALWWFQSTADFIWIRHIFPGFVPAAVVLLAGAWRAWRWLIGSPRRLERIAGVSAMVLCTVALAAGLIGRVWYVTHPPLPETLPEQRVVADVVRAQGGNELVGPWGSMPIAILAGVHPVPLHLSHEEGSPTLLVRDEEGWDDDSLCPVEVWTDGQYRLCAPAE